MTRRLKSGTRETTQKPWKRKLNLSYGRILLILLKGREDLERIFGVEASIMMNRYKKENLKDFWKTCDSKCLHWGFTFL